MKQAAIIFTLALLLTLTACGNSAADKTETSTTTSASQQVTSQATFEVSFLAAGGEAVTPYAAIIFSNGMMDMGDGVKQPISADGHLMFLSVSEYLPQIASNIPAIRVDVDSAIRITASEEVSYTPVQTVEVYGEDFALIAQDVNPATLTHITSPVYLYFKVTWENTALPYDSSSCNGYFVKVLPQPIAVTTTTAPPIVETPAIKPKVSFIAQDGTQVEPYSELICCTEIVIYSNGQTSELNGDGYLMFQSVPNRLPQIVDKIPTVTGVAPDHEIRVTVRDGVSYALPQTVEAYDEKFQPVTKDLAAHTFTSTNQPLYLFFEITFSDEEAAYTKQYSYGYFVKVLPGEPVATMG